MLLDVPRFKTIFYLTILHVLASVLDMLCVCVCVLIMKPTPFPFVCALLLKKRKKKEEIFYLLDSK